MEKDQLKVVTWNCNGRLRDKWREISDIGADIIVVQECEDPSKSTDIEFKKWAGDYLWSGPASSKGLGVFNKTSASLKLLQIPHSSSGVFIPCMLDDILVVGVWTRNAVGGDDKYIEQAFQYFMDNFALLKSSKTLIAGDFNSNAIWDKKHRKKCHTNMVKMLDDLSIISAYHTIHNQKHGSETTHTFYQYRHSDKPYHIDYCFLSKTWQLLNAEIGSASKWLNLSDHLPLVTSLGLISDRV